MLLAHQKRRNNPIPRCVLALLVLSGWFLAVSAESLPAEAPVSEDLPQLRQQLAEQQDVIEELHRQSELQRRQLNELRQSFSPEESSGVRVAEFAEFAESALPPPVSAPTGARGLQYGYADGFFVISPGGAKIGANDALFTMKVNVRNEHSSER